MVSKVADVQPASVRPLRTEDIVTVEDASVLAREHAPDIPGKLLRRVWHVRGNLKRGQVRGLARLSAIRTSFRTKSRVYIESEAWVRYEVRRHVVAELERLPGAASLPVALSSNEGAGAVELSGQWRCRSFRARAR